MINLKDYIKDYPDFPQKGVLFRDISPLLRSTAAWKEVIKGFEEYCNIINPTIIAGIESRGFLIGAAISTKLEIGFVPIRKKGKLPGEITKVGYSLEYGEDSLEIQNGIINEQDRVLIVDDLLATGGTASASVKLLEKTGANLVGLCFIVELKKFNGRNSIKTNKPIHSLITYE